MTVAKGTWAERLAAQYPNIFCQGCLRIVSEGGLDRD